MPKVEYVKQGTLLALAGTAFFFLVKIVFAEVIVTQNEFGHHVAMQAAKEEQAKGERLACQKAIADVMGALKEIKGDVKQLLRR